MQTDTDPAGAFPEYRHFRRVPVKLVDIVLHPLQRQHLVLHAVIARQNAVFGAQEPWKTVMMVRRARLRKVSTVNELTERPDPVVERHDDDVLVQQIVRPVQAQTAGARTEAATGDPDHNR